MFGVDAQDGVHYVTSALVMNNTGYEPASHSMLLGELEHAAIQMAIPTEAINTYVMLRHYWSCMPLGIIMYS